MQGSENFKLPSLLVAISITFVACGLARKSYVEKDYELNVQMTTTVGSVMMGWETGVMNPVYKNIISGMRKELTYGGIEGDVIHVSYREYTGGGYARPAFSQDLRYDLSVSNLITFQDVVIQVDTAHSSLITYTVLKEPESVRITEAELGVTTRTSSELVCGHCGVNYHENDEYCPNCGEELPKVTKTKE